MSTPFAEDIRLPIRAADVLADAISPKKTVDLEVLHGNSDLIRVLRICGVAGPFEAINPWELIDEKGVRRINAGGYSALPFGDRYPPLVEFVTRYLTESKAIGLPQQGASPWRAALETNLIALLAEHFPSHSDSRAFFSSSGAEAIETAIKFVRMARPKARCIINFGSAYHGKTLGSLALTPNPEYQDPFKPLAPGIVTVKYGDIGAFKRAVRGCGPNNVAAVFIEPVQGEGGVIIPPEGYLREVGEICAKHGILVVADEIQTGLGRCGYWFASAAGNLEPDIICLAKPLGGGLVPIGVTLARAEIYSAMLSGLSCKRHSNTFGGNSLAMAVGLKSLEILVTEKLPYRSLRLGAGMLRRLTALQKAHPHLLEAVRGQGMLAALQFQPVVPIKLPFMGEMVGELSGILGLRGLHDAGVMANLSLSSRRVVRLTPALNMPEEMVGDMMERIETFAAKSPSGPALLKNTPVSMLADIVKFAL